MEQKIYSRAATKTSLSNFVIDQQNPERSFTRRDLDLLRVEDTWVCYKYYKYACMSCSVKQTANSFSVSLLFR